MLPLRAQLKKSIISLLRVLEIVNILDDLLLLLLTHPRVHHELELTVTGVVICQIIHRVHLLATWQVTEATRRKQIRLEPREPLIILLLTSHLSQKRS